ncbi:MAG: VWA domain-containing protein [Candidatus Polarisedimenticolia bacterium]
MRRSPIVLALTAAVLLAGFAVPAPPPSETPRRIGSTEIVQVPLVLIDVVVRDSKDQPVAGLTQADFELLVDRLPVAVGDIETFEEHCTPLPEPRSAPAAVATASQALEQEPTAEPQPSAGARSIVLMFDFSHLSMAGRHQALGAARRYLASTDLSGEQIMILAHKNQLRLIQDFTSSRETLIARLDELIPDVTSLETEVLEEPGKSRDVQSRPCDPREVGTCVGRLHLAATFATEEELRTRRTLRAMEDLMPALATLPGRKALVLFSDTLRDEPGIQYLALARGTPSSVGIDIKTELLRLTREANAAGVALYTVHASGLDDISQTALARSPDPTEDFESPFRLDVTSASRSGLDAALALQSTLALETGGRAIQRTNDVGKVLAVARQDMACHYLIGYKSPGAGDNARHSLIVQLRPGPDGKPRKYDVRHRPYFIDYAPGERRDRVMRSALDVPTMHRTLPVSLEAFALAPTRFGRRVLVKAMVPLSSMTLLPSGRDRLEGRVRIRGEAWRSGDTACQVDVEVPVSVPRSGAEGTLVYETGCALMPGLYALSLAMMDMATQEVGASREPLLVPRQPNSGESLVSDVHLWVEDPDALLVSTGVEDLGMEARPSGERKGALLPMGRRVLRSRQPAILSVLLCPGKPGKLSADAPINVQRTLRGEGGAVVADFKDLVVTEPPDPATGCYQLIHQIPGETLGPGVYTYSLHVTGPPVGAPITREADIAVE